jgi:HK97 family phage prohead protease
VNRRAASLRRAQGGYRAPADRPRSRRCLERDGAPALARAHLFGVEVRDTPDADGSVGFRAYASVTETAYSMWDMFGPYDETIAADAFDQTLADNADVAFLLNHGGMTLARTASGTLALGVDDAGLWYEPRLDPQNSVVRDVLSGVRRGDLNESSFAFRIVRGTWSPDFMAYRIEQVDMHRGDVSIVNYGANPATGDHPIGLGLSADDVDVDALDVDQLDDAQALALAGRLEQRTARRAAHERAAHHTMTRAELDEFAAIAAPHPLAGRVHN